MPFCPQCGNQVDGRFCEKCGAAVAPAEITPNPAPVTSTSGLSENVASALCYVLGFITGILFLVIEPYNRNRNIRFHAFQSIFLSVAVIVISIILSSLFVFAFGMWWMLFLLFRLACFILWLYMMWKAYNNQKVVLPVIGPIAERQA